MIEFLSLFLGLVLGPQVVELAVTEPVAAVEVRLDGRLAGRLLAPPWRLVVDLGGELEPHLLEAVGLDAEGREIARVRQRINYGRSNYEAVLVLEDPEPEGRRGRIVWRSLRDLHPSRMRLRLDGEPLSVARDGGFRLPPLEGEGFHFLEAELRWAGDVARAQLGFGGELGESLTTALTPVPVRLAGGSDPPEPSAMHGWFVREGRALEVFSLSREEGTLLVVRDRGVGKALKRVKTELRRRDLALPPVLPAGIGVRFVSTAAAERQPGIFPSYAAGRSDVAAGLWKLVANRYHQTTGRRPQRIWDAVAVAGKRAAEGGGVRAVLVLLGPSAEDASTLAPYQALGYLRSLRVPCLLWAGEAAHAAGRSVAGHRTVHIGTDGMIELFEALARTLEEQAVVWLEGEHFPRQITLSTAAPAMVRLLE